MTSIKPLQRLRNSGQEIALALLHAYKYAVSPLIGGACRFYPSCSEFAAEAVRRHGIVRGNLLALGRLLRCHPFGSGGYDPVPRAPLGNTPISGLSKQS